MPGVAAKAYATPGSFGSTVGAWSMQVKPLPPGSHALVLWLELVSAGNEVPVTSQCLAGAKKEATLFLQAHEGLQQSQ